MLATDGRVGGRATLQTDTENYIYSFVVKKSPFLLPKKRHESEDMNISYKGILQVVKMKYWDLF